MLRTARLVLRDWRDSDLEPFAAMGQDREVMEHFPSLLDRDRSAALIGRVRDHIAREGFGFWAVEHEAQFIGFCGISRPPFQAHFTPCVEIGWRFARFAWGHGYATEAARAALAFGWEIGLAEIVAFLLPMNRRSAAVCERIGMTRDPNGNFDHPMIPEGAVSIGGHLQQRHCLYRVRRQNAPALEVEPPKS